MVAELSINLQGKQRFQSIVNQLNDDFTQWPSVIFHERGLVAFEQYQGSLTSTLVSFAGDFSLSKEFLKDDNALNRILYCHDCPWVSQELLQVRESDFHYWLVQKSVFTRRIDLMKPDQYLAITGFDEFTERQLIGNSFIAIKVNSDFCTMTLLFSQKTFQFVDAIPYRHLEPISLCVDDEQFFGASKYDWYLEDILVFKGDTLPPRVINLEEIYNDIKEQDEQEGKD